MRSPQSFSAAQWNPLCETWLIYKTPLSQCHMTHSQCHMTSSQFYMTHLQCHGTHLQCHGTHSQCHMTHSQCYMTPSQYHMTHYRTHSQCYMTHSQGSLLRHNPFLFINVIDSSYNSFTVLHDSYDMNEYGWLTNEFLLHYEWTMSHRDISLCILWMRHVALWQSCRKSMNESCSTMTEESSQNEWDVSHYDSFTRSSCETWQRDSVWDMTHCETWPIVRHDSMWDMTHSHGPLVRHNPFIFITRICHNVTCPIHTLQRPLLQCDMTRSYFKDTSVTVRHASFRLLTQLCPSATWLIHNAHKIISRCNMVHSQCNEDSFVMIYTLSHDATLIRNTMGIVIRNAVNIHS